MNEDTGLETENTGRRPDPSLKRAMGHRKKRTRLAILILLVVMIPTLIFALYPRTEVEVVVWYSEVMGTLNVDVEVRNVGTVRIDVEDAILTVRNDTGGELGAKGYGDFTLRPRRKFEGQNLQLTQEVLVNDTLWSTFTLSLDMKVTSNSKSFEFHEDFVTEEPDMMITFKAKRSEW